VKTLNEATNQNHHAGSHVNGHVNAHANGHSNGSHRGGSGLWLQPRGLRKIRCPHCEVINLEKFVTFPHCAGCGALLNKENAPRPKWTAWRRPLGPLLWASVICLAAAGIVGGAMMLRRPAAIGQLVIYGQTARRLPVGSTMQLSLTVDAIGTSTRETAMLREVSIRLDDKFLRKFALVTMEPAPRRRTRSGSGHYFLFEQVPRETQFAFNFKALRAGRHKLQAQVNATAHMPTDYAANITVIPAGELH
jgi:hypothetical protein